MALYGLKSAFTDKLRIDCEFWGMNDKILLKKRSKFPCGYAPPDGNY